MLKRILTILLVLVVVVGATATIGFAENTVVYDGTESTVTITEDTTLDLDGKTLETLIVEPGATVTLVGGGRVNAINGITDGAGTVVLANEKKVSVDINGTAYQVSVSYLNLNGAELALGNAGVVLSMNDVDKNGAGMYYTCAFGGNATVKSMIKTYGVALYVGSAKNLFADKTYTQHENLSGWNTNKVFSDNSVLLKGILKTGNAYSVNKSNAGKQIYNVPYVELNSGIRITGATAEYSLKNAVEKVTDDANPGSATWDKLSYTQKTNVVNLYNTFERFMSAWDMPRLEPLVDESKSTAYPLYTASDVQMMASNPDESYFLNNYINMGGVTLNTIENFTGSIDGDGHSINNFKLNGIGFVDTLAAGQTIKDLYLSNVTVTVPADSTAQNVGIIAGTNNGSIVGCAASGTITDTRENVYMGALVGKNAGSVSTYGIFEDTHVVNTLKTDGSGIGDGNTTYETTGLAAIVGLYNDAEGVTKGLIGTGTAVENAANVYWRDASNSTDRQEQVLQDRRQAAVDYVYQSGTIKWTVPSTITYYNDQANYSALEKPSGFWGGVFSGSFHIHTQQFKKGTTYIGIPYTHGSSSLEQFQYYTQGGVLNQDIANLKGGNNGYSHTKETGVADWTSSASKDHAQYDPSRLGWAKYIGSDCSSALTMAWHKVSPISTSDKTDGGVCLYYTTNIVPSEYNQYYYGVRQVGDYVVNDETMSDGKKLTGTKTVDEKKVEYELTYTVGGVTKYQYSVTTDKIVEKIGVNAVYEAYAQTQMGDILNSSGTAGHSRMAAIDPIVIRNGNGDIDPAQSYFITHEQGDGLYDRAETNSSWRINYKYTFEQLAYQNTENLTGSSGYYLPVSMDAFHGDAKHQTSTGFAGGGREATYTNTNDKVVTDPSYIALNSYYRIQSATMVIKDLAGNELYRKTAYQGTSGQQSRRRAIPGSIPMFLNEFFSDYGEKLTEGQTYTYTITGKTFAHEEEVPVRTYTDVKFVYTPSDYTGPKKTN